MSRLTFANLYVKQYHSVPNLEDVTSKYFYKFIK
jgi:hypothetical protein